MDFYQNEMKVSTGALRAKVQDPRTRLTDYYPNVTDMYLNHVCRLPEVDFNRRSCRGSLSSSCDYCRLHEKVTGTNCLPSESSEKSRGLDHSKFDIFIHLIILVVVTS